MTHNYHFGFDGSRSTTDGIYAAIFERAQTNFGNNLGYTIFDETNIWSTPNPDRCKICWADPGECTHTGWKPKVHVHAERVGPPAIGDGVLRPDRVLYTWPMILRRVTSPLERELFENHAPWMGGATTRPRCDFCAEHWPCDNARALLDHLGLTEHDFDFRPEDNVDA